MVSAEILIAITIFVILTIIAIAIVVTSSVTKKPPENDTSQMTMVNFMAPCSTTSCNEGLVCDETVFLCKNPPDSVCLVASDCANGYFCSGRCVTGAVGGLNSFCPCLPGYLCDQEESGYSVCKGGSGTSCQTDIDCFSIACVDNACLGGYPNAYVCVNDTDCLNLNCSSGFCQPEGFQTGSLGSQCAGDCVAWTGSTCDVPGSSCVCTDGSDEPGFCLELDIGFLLNCVPGQKKCSDIYQCEDLEGGPCPPGSTAGSECICEFPYPDPTAVTQIMSCIGGMTAGSSGTTCLNDIGLGCSNGFFCASGVCGGPSVLVTFSFDSVVQSNFFGATAIDALPITNGPTSATQIIKMLGTSTGTVDTIYALDFSEGLFEMQYETSSQRILSDWASTKMKVLSGTSSVADISYNGTTFLVTYQQSFQGLTGQVLYSGTDLTNLNPVPSLTISTPGLPGQQAFGGSYLDIISASISPANDLSPGGDILVNEFYPEASAVYPFTLTLAKSYNNLTGSYQPVPTTGTPHPVEIVSPGVPVVTPRFYYDILQQGSSAAAPICPSNAPAPTGASIQCESIYNVSYVGLNPPTYIVPESIQGLQFTGNVYPVSLPLDRNTGKNYVVLSYDIYSPPGIGMIESRIITLGTPPTNGQGTFGQYLAAVLTYAGTNAALPYIVTGDGYPPILATANAYYIFNSGSCSSQN